MDCLMQIKNFIPFGKPSLHEAEFSNVYSVLKSKWIGTGPIVEKFEKNFSNYKKSNYAISVNSCTAALHLSLISLGLKKGDEVITTPMTFAATINSIVLAGCKPVLVDIRPDTLNINEKIIEKKITKKTKAILIVHFGGIPCELTNILKIVKKYKLKLIEDCAHAIESKFNNKHVGNFGDAGCFSFYANKNITTGEGGMLTCSKKSIDEKIRILRLHGMSKDAWKRYAPDSVPRGTPYQHYDVKYVGLKYNMIDISAAMGIEQLNRIDIMWKKRQELVKRYQTSLKDLPLFFQGTKDYKYKNAHHLFTITIDKRKTNKNRDRLLKFLNDNKIGVGVNYRSVTSMSCYKKLFLWNNKTTPVSNYVGSNILSLPLYPDLKKSEQNYIIYKVKEFFKST